MSLCKAHGRPVGPISGQCTFTDSLLLLIEITCAGVTELRSVVCVLLSTNAIHEARAGADHVKHVTPLEPVLPPQLPFADNRGARLSLPQRDRPRHKRRLSSHARYRRMPWGAVEPSL